MNDQRHHRDLPPAFTARLRELEDAYLASDDPIRQSGFSGGVDRWRREHEPVLDALQRPGGDLLDVGCANGYLLECLVEWGRERDLDVVPFGIDYGSRLIDLARKRLPRFATNFWVANAWDWDPPRRYQFVYALCDCVPQEYLREFVRRLMNRYVQNGGRLILGSYGSRSRNEQPFDLERFLTSAGYRLRGTASVGVPPVTRFAWIDRSTSG